MNGNPWGIRLVAVMIIALVLITVSVIASCRDDSPAAVTTQATTKNSTALATDNNTETTEVTSAVSTDTTDVTETSDIPVVATEEAKDTPTFGYVRADLSGTAVSATVSNGTSVNTSAYTSVSGIALLNDAIYVSDETGMHVYKLSADGAKQKTYSAKISINSVVTDGVDIYSLEGGLSGTVVKLSADLKAMSSCKVGHTPSDMAIVGKKGYVVNRFSNTVSVIDLEKMQVISTVEIDGREPIAAVAAGSDVYVACHLPDEATTESVISANVAVISSESDTVSTVIPLVNGASGVKDICAAPDGKSVYVSHVIGRYAYPTTQLDRGWINTNGFSVIDTVTKSCLYTCLLDEVDEGAANPWGITVSADGKYLCVALSGLDEIMLVDLSQMQLKISRVKNGRDTKVSGLSDIVNYLPFLDGTRERITVGKGVRAIVEKDGILYCGLYFDGAVDAINLSDRSVKRLQFTTQPEASPVRTGQILWSDANNCYQRWQSCNSCHPDGVVDGFNWDNLNDGLGNGKSAKSMLYSHRTPPVMVTGIRTSAEIAVAAGMKFIQFNTMSVTELSYIDEYLKSLAPISSPALETNGVLTESAKSGEILFEKNCASCHPAPLYTDMKEHKVGTAKLAREDGYYDTPTLIEVWRTAPYLHDGSMSTIEEVVKFFAKDLSDAEVAQLSDYVRSIGNNGEYYGAEQIAGKKKNGESAYNIYADGMQISTITVRKQLENAPDRVIVAFSVYDKGGSQVYYCDSTLSGIDTGSSAVITLKDSVTLPSGGYYTIVFYDAATGEAVSSVLKIK